MERETYSTVNAMYSREDTYNGRCGVGFLILCISLFFLFSCYNDKNSLLINKEFLIESESPGEFVKLSDALHSYLDEISKIHMFLMDRYGISSYTFTYQGDKPLLRSEMHIRQNGNKFIFDEKNNGNQMEYIALLMKSAKRIEVDAEENVPQTILKDDLLWVRLGGCVIDLIDWDNNIIITYIMQNGLDVFYEKGKEGVYYEMPKILLDKFVITDQEFINAYRELL